MANPKPVRSPKTEFKLDNQANVRHGGEGALVRLRKGEPFIGLAREVLEGVLVEVGISLDDLAGIESILVKRAARFEATARMFDHAADAAAVKGDLDRWERYQQRSGWIGSRAFNALDEVRAMLEKRAAGTLAISRIIEADSNGDDPGLD